MNQVQYQIKRTQLARLHQLLKKFNTITSVRIIIPPGSYNSQSKLMNNIQKLRPVQESIKPEHVHSISTERDTSVFRTVLSQDKRLQVLPSGKAVYQLQGSESEYIKYQSYGGCVFFDLNSKQTISNKLTVYSRACFNEFIISSNIQLVSNFTVHKSINTIFECQSHPLSDKSLQLCTQLKNSTTYCNLSLLYYACQNTIVNEIIKTEEQVVYKPSVQQNLFADHISDATVYQLKKCVLNGTQLTELFSEFVSPFFAEITFGGAIGFGDSVLERRTKAVISVGANGCFVDVW
ncbi:Hypothetical_protein [Hexamita inflata]|uniref:Hypothetical_protein n=1 Tax=Hexamita inflata TaxID=28002 RepID=A0ABP1KAU1_9EUKA